MTGTDLPKDAEKQKTTLVRIVLDECLAFLAGVAPCVVFVVIGLTAGLLIAIVFPLILLLFTVWSSYRKQGKAYFEQDSSDAVIVLLGLLSLAMQNPIWYQIHEFILFVLGPVSWILLGRSLLTSKKSDLGHPKGILIRYIAGSGVFPSISLCLALFASQKTWLCFYLFWTCAVELVRRVNDVWAAIKHDRKEAAAD